MANKYTNRHYRGAAVARHIARADWLALFSHGKATINGGKCAVLVREDAHEKTWEYVHVISELHTGKN